MAPDEHPERRPDGRERAKERVPPAADPVDHGHLVPQPQEALVGQRSGIRRVVGVGG